MKSTLIDQRDGPRRFVVVLATGDEATVCCLRLESHHARLGRYLRSRLVATPFGSRAATCPIGKSWRAPSTRARDPASSAPEDRSRGSPGSGGLSGRRAQAAVSFPGADAGASSAMYSSRRPRNLLRSIARESRPAVAILSRGARYPEAAAACACNLLHAISSRRTCHR